MEELKQEHLDEREIREGAPFAAVSYILFLWLLAFILKKDNKFSHYHARQGLVLFIGEIISLFLPALGIIGYFLFKLSWLLFLIFSLYGVYSSLTGKLCRIPVVTKVASKLIV